MCTVLFLRLKLQKLTNTTRESTKMKKTFGQFYFTSLFFAFDFFLPFLIEYYQFCTKRIPFIMWLKCTLSSILTCDRKHSHMNRINIILNSFFLCSLHFFFFWNVPKNSNGFSFICYCIQIMTTSMTTTTTTTTACTKYTKDNECGCLKWKLSHIRWNKLWLFR